MLVACRPDSEGRVPTVVEPRCAEPSSLPTSETRVATHAEPSDLSAHAGCDAASTTTYADTLATLRPDGTVDETDLVIERRIFSSRYPNERGSSCRFVIETRVWQEKLDARLEIAPAPAEVSLCDARITSPHASALVAAGARATVERIDVGAAPSGGPIELQVLLREPRDVAITETPAATPCGDEDDVTARIDRYAFAHRVVMQMPLADAARFAWDSVLELDYEVRAVSAE
jgi:hypothetical protein